MNYSVETLKEEIRVVMDQNRDDIMLLEGAGDVETLALDRIILGNIVNAATYVERNAAQYLLDNGVPLEFVEVKWNDNGTGSMILPENFMRLVSFKMSDWEIAVTEPITDGNPIYAQQHSRYGGVRGNTQRPVVAIVKRPSGLLLEFFSCKDRDATVELASYIPEPYIDEYGNIEICERLKSAIVYYAAYLTAISTGEAALAEALLGIANELNK